MDWDAELRRVIPRVLAAGDGDSAGIRAGRDEVLEAGVSRALGREFRLRR